MFIDQGFDEIQNQDFDNSMLNESVLDSESFDLLGLSDESASIEAQEMHAVFSQDFFNSGDIELDQMHQELIEESLDVETDQNIGKVYTQAEIDTAVLENEVGMSLKDAIENHTANFNGVNLNANNIDSIDINMDMAPIHQTGGHFRSKYSIDGFPARITLKDGSHQDVIFKQDDCTGKFELHKLKAFGDKGSADEIFDYSPSRKAAKNQVKLDSLNVAMDEQKAKVDNLMNRLTTNQSRPTRRAQTNTQINDNVSARAEARKQARLEKAEAKKQERLEQAEAKKQASAAKTAAFGDNYRNLIKRANQGLKQMAFNEMIKYPEQSMNQLKTDRANLMQKAKSLKKNGDTGMQYKKLLMDIKMIDNNINALKPFMPQKQ